MANYTGVATDQPDINGGTIDGAVIGGTSAVAGTFTTLTATGKFGANGSAAVSAAATVAAITTTVLSSGFGFQTSANALAAMNAINSIITCLKDAGLMAS